MRKNKWGSMRLLKKILKRESLCRSLSLLLSFCMLLSIFSGMASYSAFAQEDGQTEKAWEKSGQTETDGETDEEVDQPESGEETLEEIKSRLVRQIRDEGWEPYSADMSLDEFFALVELFQEGTLPLEEESRAAVSPIAGDSSETETDETDENTEPDGFDDTEDMETDGSEEDTEGLDIEEPEMKTEVPGTETSGKAVEPSETEDSDNGDLVDDEGDGAEGSDEDEADDAEGSDEDETDGTEETYADTPGPDSRGIEIISDDDPVPAAEEGESDDVYIPRTMFMFRGLKVEGSKDDKGNDITSRPGRDVAEDQEYGPPLVYDDSKGNDEDGINGIDIVKEYMPGLDPLNRGFTRPPKGWNGVKTTDEKLQAFVTRNNANSNDPTIVGDVIQNLFLQYDGYYVYEVTARDANVTVLGAIEMEGTYIYYYTNREEQSTKVSTTTLPEGEKFIIRYEPYEHTIEYKVLLAGDNPTNPTDGSGEDVTKEDVMDWIDRKWLGFDGGIPADGENNIYDVTAARRDEIYGTDLPMQSNLGAYAFSAQVPDGYTLSFYMSVKNINGWAHSSLRLATYGENGGPGDYTSVNKGWALGAEPDYSYNPDNSSFKTQSDPDKGPEYLTKTGVFYNSLVDGDRIIIAVLRKKPTPTFRITPLEGDVLLGVRGRGTLAAEDYDWDADYNFHHYDEEVTDEPNPYTDPYSTHEAAYPNLAKLEKAGTWNWDNSRFKNGAVDMTKDMDGTYSYSLIFQTNEPGQKFYLDVLEVNRTGITLPFYPHHTWHGNNDKYNGDQLASDAESGLQTWKTETILPDGAVVTVEYLLGFGTVQRQYRITVTGAKNNITINAMNLMMYQNGAPEFSLYQLDGITGATSQEDTARLAAIQYYNRSNKWSDNVNRGNVVVDENRDGINHGIKYDTSKSSNDGGDDKTNGANIRFKLAEGYGSPYYLYETSRDGVIKGTGGENDLQASAERDAETGHVIKGSENPVVPLIADGTKPYMRYDNNGKPSPVDSNGNALYWYNDETGDYEQFRDWEKIRVRTVEQDDGTVRDTLFPDLYSTSTPPDEGVSPLTETDVIALPIGTPLFKWDPNAKFKSQYIYGPDANGWYYIRVTGQGKWVDGNYDPKGAGGSEPDYGYKMALLTIVAYPRRYLVRYKPNTIPEVVDGAETVPARPPRNMPTYEHSQDCPTFVQPDIDPEKRALNSQFDDNNGDFYDIEVNPDADISATRPEDPRGYYTFDGWQLVDENDNPIYMHVYDEEGNWKKDDEEKYILDEVVFFSGAVDIRPYVDYAILNGDLGTVDTDIYVLRLMPKWKKVAMPYHYMVALNWMDAQGNLYEEYFDEFWDDVLTDFDEDTGNNLVVKILTEADPFKEWNARYPTYTFWDAVNNETNETRIMQALNSYLPANVENRDKKYQAALNALLNRDIGVVVDEETGERQKDGINDFSRLGNYTYTVLEDRATIVLWMYENKGGLTVHKSVDAEPFIYDDEFYFTVDQVTVGNNGEKLTGEYMAFPEVVYDNNGAVREREARDAWNVTFTEGKITRIMKNDGSEEPTDHFTLKDGQGFMLFVPEGKYAIRELGSKSGGSYRVEVNYMDRNGNTQSKGSWEFPNGIQWLKGSEKTYQGVSNSGITTFPKDISQVSATVDFGVGEHEMASTIIFSNQTSTVAFEKAVVGGTYNNESFGFEAALILPEGTAPLQEGSDSGYYYFNFNLYDVDYGNGQADVKPPKPVNPGPKPGTNSPGYQEWLDKYEDWQEWLNWRPDGNPKLVYTGRVVVTKSTEDDSKWTLQHLLIPDGDSWKQVGDEGDEEGIIRLTRGQRFYVVCTVPESGEDINYIITEKDPHGFRVEDDEDGVKAGWAAAGELAYELFTNTKYAIVDKSIAGAADPDNAGSFETGEEITFVLTASLSVDHNTAARYTLHDTMVEGLTYLGGGGGIDEKEYDDVRRVYVKVPDEDGVFSDSEGVNYNYYLIDLDTGSGEGYQLSVDESDAGTIIEITTLGLELIKGRKVIDKDSWETEGDAVTPIDKSNRAKIVVEYTAVLNEKAVLDSLSGNLNKVELPGVDSSTITGATEATANVYHFGVELYKYDGSKGKAYVKDTNDMEGVGFALTKKSGGATLYALLKEVADDPEEDPADLGENPDDSGEDPDDPGEGTDTPEEDAKTPKVHYAIAGWVPQANLKDVSGSDSRWVGAIAGTDVKGYLGAGFGRAAEDSYALAVRTDADGYLRIEGMDSGNTYYLKEVITPGGFATVKPISIRFRTSYYPTSAAGHQAGDLRRVTATVGGGVNAATHGLVNSGEWQGSYEELAVKVEVANRHPEIPDTDTTKLYSDGLYDLGSLSKKTAQAAGILPQTGQLWWPVPLLLALGVTLLIIGAALFTRKRE